MHAIYELKLRFTSDIGYKKAVHVVRSVIEYFNEYGSSVYLSALDITKAYDRLNNCAVPLKMKQIGVSVDIIVVF